MELQYLLNGNTSLKPITIPRVINLFRNYFSLGGISVWTSDRKLLASLIENQSRPAFVSHSWMSVSLFMMLKMVLLKQCFLCINYNATKITLRPQGDFLNWQSKHLSCQRKSRCHAFFDSKPLMVVGVQGWWESRGGGGLGVVGGQGAGGASGWWRSGGQ